MTDLVHQNHTPLLVLLNLSFSTVYLFICTVRLRFALLDIEAEMLDLKSVADVRTKIAD